MRTAGKRNTSAACNKPSHTVWNTNNSATIFDASINLSISSLLLSIAILPAIIILVSLIIL